MTHEGIHTGQSPSSWDHPCADMHLIMQQICPFGGKIVHLTTDLCLQVGPESKDSIRSLYGKGHLCNATLFRSAAMAEPAPLASIRELRWWVATGPGQPHCQQKPCLPRSELQDGDVSPVVVPHHAVAGRVQFPIGRLAAVGLVGSPACGCMVSAMQAWSVT